MSRHVDITGFAPNKQTPAPRQATTAAQPAETPAQEPQTQTPTPQETQVERPTPGPMTDFGKIVNREWNSMISSVGGVSSKLEKAWAAREKELEGLKGKGAKVPESFVDESRKFIRRLTAAAGLLNKALQTVDPSRITDDATLTGAARPVADALNTLNKIGSEALKKGMFKVVTRDRKTGQAVQELLLAYVPQQVAQTIAAVIDSVGRSFERVQNALRPQQVEDRPMAAAASFARSVAVKFGVLSIRG